MNKGLIAVISSLVLTVAAVLFIIAHQPKVAKPSATPLALVTQATAKQSIFDAGKPVFVLVTGADCDTCADAETLVFGQIAKHPEMQFVKIDGADFGFPPVTTPGALIVVPGVGPAFQNQKFQPTTADIDAFMAKRSAVAMQEQTLGKRVSDAKTALDAAEKPYNDQLADLQKQADAILKPFNDQLVALRQQQAVTAKPFEDQIDPLEQQIATVQQPFAQQAQPILAARQTAVKDIAAQYQAAEKAGDQAKMDDLKAKYLAAEKPFKDQLDALQKQMDVATKPLNDQIDAIKKQEDDALKPLADQITAVRTQAMAAIQPLKDKAQPIADARDQATKDLAAQSTQAQSDLDAFMKADDAGNQAPK